MPAAPQRKGRRRGGLGFAGAEGDKRKLLMSEIEKLANPDNIRRTAIGDLGLDSDSGGEFGSQLDFKKASTTKKSRKE